LVAQMHEGKLGELALCAETQHLDIRVGQRNFDAPIGRLVVIDTNLFSLRCVIVQEVRQHGLFIETNSVHHQIHRLDLVRLMQGS
jgi:hypothetical protein